MIAYLISLSLLITLFIIVRALFRKNVSAMMMYCLWSLVLIRLLCPVSLFTLYIPQAQPQQGMENNLPSQMPSQNTRGEVVLPSWSFEEELQGEAASTLPQGKPQQTIAQKGFKLSENLDKLWIAGSLLVGSWFVVSYGRFTANLIKNRRYIGSRSGVGLYRCKGLKSPCLSMSGRSIYLTENEDFKGEDMVIEHEMTHREHKDHIWNFVRIAAVTLLWFLPFVWLAAILSKQDSELACDEAMASKMSYSMRIKYANVLLDAAEQKGMYAVPWGGSPMKERITMLTKKHKNRMICTILALVMILGAAGCSFVGVEPKIAAGDHQQELDKAPATSITPTSTAASTNASATTAPVTTAPAPSRPYVPPTSTTPKPLEHYQKESMGDWGLRVGDLEMEISTAPYHKTVYISFSFNSGEVIKEYIAQYETDDDGYYDLTVKQAGRSDVNEFKASYYFPSQGKEWGYDRYFEIISCEDDEFLEMISRFDKQSLDNTFEFSDEGSIYTTELIEDKGEFTRYKVNYGKTTFYADFPSEWLNAETFDSDGKPFFVTTDGIPYYENLDSVVAARVRNTTPEENWFSNNCVFDDGYGKDWENPITGVTENGVKYVIYRSTKCIDVYYHPYYTNPVFILDNDTPFYIDFWEHKYITGDYSSENTAKSREAFLNEVILPVINSISFEK